MAKDINVALGDSEPLWTEAVAQTLQGRFKCVGRAHTGRDLIDLVKEAKPDIAVMGLEYPDVEGVMILRTLSHNAIKCRCLVITRHMDQAFVALQAGACGFLSKADDPMDIQRALQHTFDGYETITDKALPGLVNHIRQMDVAPKLTRKEMSVLQGLATTGNQGQIAKDLFMSRETVRTHIKSIYRKLDVHSAPEAVHKAHTLGILL